MSHRNSSPHCSHSNDSSDQTSESENQLCFPGNGNEGDLVATASKAKTCVTERGGKSSGTIKSRDSGSKPTLDSLLASCGALQIALRESNSEEGVAEIHGSADFGVGTDSFSTETIPDVDADACAPTSRQPANAAIQLDQDITGTESTLISLLRQEFRGSIDELKAAHAAAAASQGAVLKTLTEIIFQSSAMRDNGSGGLDERLSELEDRIVSRIGQVHGLDRFDRSSARNTTGESTSTGSTNSGNNVSRSWAELRSDLVSKSEASEESANGVSDRIDHSQVGLHKKCANQAEENATIEVPRAIDPETLDLKELRAVFYERESFISTLIGRLRQVHLSGNVRLPAEELRNMAELLPEELSVEVMRTLSQLDEISRIGELELSLERARLARQVNQLDNSRQQIEHNARQLGLELGDDGTLLNPEKLTPRVGGSRRWLSKLGFGA